GGLSAAGFAHQPQRLAVRDPEAHAVYCVYFGGAREQSRLGREELAELLHFEQDIGRSAHWTGFQQAAQWPEPWAVSGGASCEQRGIAFGQRGAKRHPGCSSFREGTIPGISTKRLPPSPRAESPRCGMEPSSPRVYGWRGRAKSS